MQYCAYCGNAVEAVSHAPCPRCGNPSNGAPRPNAGAKGTNTALIVVIVIVGGLMIVAVIGILAAIAIPNFLNAKQRATQKRTMADIRSLSAAIEAYSTDNNSEYPKGSTVTDLAGALSPKYMKIVPAVDGWGHAIKYTCLKDATTPGSDKCAGYAIASAGKDGIFEQPSLEDAASQAPRPTTSFDCDIVYSNGKFVEYPEGAQH